MGDEAEQESIDYATFRANNSPDTWGSLSMTDWRISRNMGQQLHWDDWPKARRRAIAFQRLLRRRASLKPL